MSNSIILTARKHAEHPHPPRSIIKRASASVSSLGNQLFNMMSTSKPSSQQPPLEADGAFSRASSSGSTSSSIGKTLAWASPKLLYNQIFAGEKSKPLPPILADTIPEASLESSGTFMFRRPSTPVNEQVGGEAGTPTADVAACAGSGGAQEEEELAVKRMSLVAADGVEATVLKLKVEEESMGPVLVRRPSKGSDDEGDAVEKMMMRLRKLIGEEQVGEHHRTGGGVAGGAKIVHWKSMKSLKTVSSFRKSVSKPLSQERGKGEDRDGRSDEERARRFVVDALSGSLDGGVGGTTLLEESLSTLSIGDWGAYLSEWDSCSPYAQSAEVTSLIQKDAIGPPQGRAGTTRRLAVTAKHFASVPHAESKQPRVEPGADACERRGGGLGEKEEEGLSAAVGDGEAGWGGETGLRWMTSRKDRGQ